MHRAIAPLALSVLLSLSCAAAPWDMHEIDSRFRGANALSPGDANGDGRTDYVTNYEFDQRVVVALHPGSADPRRHWPTAEAWAAPRAPEAGVNPEHATLADLDADGAIDIIVAQGYSSLASYDGSSPGVRVLWGRVRADPQAGWSDGGRVPATADAGHFLYVQALDIDADGRLEVVAGGRVHAGTGRRTGLLWLEPSHDDPRDLARWTTHAIDPEQWSGHGFVFEDVDEDGDADIALANADWDTPDSDEEVVWYENPGAADIATSLSWAKHAIYRGGEFFAKPQVAVADLDRDGRRDLVTQVRDAFYWFRKTSVAPVVWERVVLSKDPVAQWLGRGVRVADINGDGRLDLVGALIHDAGLLPPDRAALFWMEPLGDPEVDGWATHVIKWGSGRTMLIPVFGEKWDQLDVSDVDGDGDLDVVGNCEEWWEDGGVMAPFFDPAALPALVAVAWFENPSGEPRRLFAEVDGVCAFEAERPSGQGDGSWIPRDAADAGGSGAMVDANVIVAAPRLWGDTAGLTFDARLDGGAYDVWVRLRAPTRWGPLLGGAKSDSLWLAVDGEPAAAVGDLGLGSDWVWTRAMTARHLAAGEHTIRVRAREGGCAVDRVVVQRSAQPAPTGLGPAASPLL